MSVLPPPIDWTAIEKDVLAQVITLAEEIIQPYIKQAQSDSQDFLTKSKDFIITAAKQLATGEIDQELFQSELRGRLDDAEFLALEQAGLAQVRFDMFIDGLVKILTAAVTAAIKVIP
jgi:hypothetical protein